ncbi:MAG: iron ABC transporter permease [Treponemataceae bacterium]|nr:iron ABC transporter permease [Treponemataceae bacterium]
MKLSKNSFWLLFVISIFLLFVLSFLSIFLETSSLSFKEAISLSSEIAKIVILQVRLPRTLSIIVCAIAFSISGLLLQTSLNNVLASPGIIGINSGSALFVLIISLCFPYSALAKSCGALLGSFLAISLVYFISIKGGVSKTTLILSGVAVSSFLTAGSDIIITLHPEIIADKVAFSLGGFQNVSFSSLEIASPIVVLCIVCSFVLAKGMDLFELGDEVAFGLGLNVKLYRILSIFVASFLAASAVSICGLLSFMGLIIPNLVRIFLKGSKTPLWKKMLFCMTFGADFLLLCDILSRVIFFPYELPVGLFLSTLGSPFFIWMIATKKKQLSV